MKFVQNDGRVTTAATGLREGNTVAAILDAEVRKLRAERAVLGKEVDRLQTMACGAVDAARDAEAEVARLTAERDAMKAALDVADRVLHFDLRKMIEWGPEYNQAVKDAADAVRAALNPTAK